MDNANVISLLTDLDRLGIRLTIVGDQLKLNAPKGAITAELRQRVKQHKTALIALQQTPFAKGNTIPPASDEPYLPCSFAQQRLWLLDQLEPGSCAYNIPIFWRIAGDLNIAVLCQAVNAIIQRHASLRTVFRAPPDNDAIPQQIVLPVLNIDAPTIDLTRLAPDEIESAIHKQATQALQTPFDLSQGPLLRLRVLQINPRNHVLLLTVHHIIFDGLSLDIFLQELGVLYPAFMQQQPSPLPDPAIQYTDYTIWQRKRLNGPYLREHLDFWHQQLQDAPPTLNLPTDYARPATPNHAGARQSFTLETETTQKLRQLAQRNGATLFMALHAVLAILLARYINKEDIVIGSPIANRTHQQLEQLIGLFTNTLVLRTPVKPDQSFNQLLAAIKQHTLQAYRYQELPFEKLVDELKIPRSIGHNPLFQVSLSLQNGHTEHFSLPGLDISPLEFNALVAKFDLSVIIHEYAEKLAVIFEYRTALFANATVERMMGHFQVLVDGLLRQPDAPIAQSPILTQTEIQQFRIWNDTAVAYAKEKTLIRLFEEQVTRTPDKVAVVFNDQELTYQALNQQVNQLAHSLLRHTACKDHHNPCIAVCVERSMEMLIGVLGTMKAGAAYVPIDPDYPQARIHHMLIDSQALIILTQRHLHDRLPSTITENSAAIQQQVLYLDETTFSSCPTDNPPLTSQPTDLAYVIYTSGSTGNPKGVMVTHANLSNLLQDMQQRTGIHENNKLLAAVTLSFDMSVLELFLPLISGSQLYLADQTITRDAQALQQQLVENNISFMQVTPATWQLLRQSDWQAQHPMKNICGGEVMTPELGNYLLQNSSELWNSYGPTETTVFSTTSLISKTLESTATIGRPIANTRIYILNNQQQIQPVGIPGELCIAGDGVTRGYLNRPVLTAEKFIDIELMGRQERIYKTGDLARWLPDGDLEFLGRIDHQVKIRGFRIEPGEIESRLLQNPAVRRVLVTPRTTPSGEQQLVAYILPAHHAAQQNMADQLKTDLQTELPDYMIPAFFVMLNEFPLLPNGKINRPALPEPDGFNIERQTYMHPRNSLELQLNRIWENVLSVSPISVFDDFFNIGGDSLLAIRLINLINQQFGTQVPLNALFQSSTIEQLALLLRRDNQNHQTNSPLVTLQSQGSNAPIFCVHAAGGIVFRYMQIAKWMSSQYGHPFHGLQAKGIEPGETPYSSIEEMAQCYVQAIRQIKPHGPYLLAGWSFGGTVAFAMAEILESAGETVSGIIMIDAPSPDMDAYETDDVDFLLERLEPAAGISLQNAVEQQTTAQAKKQFILEQKKQLGLFPPDIKPEEAEQRLAVHKHHNRLLCQYRPHNLIHAGIAFIQATETTRFDEKMKDPVPAWSQFTRQPIIEYQAPGNHFNMFANQYTRILAEKIQACIKQLTQSREYTSHV